MEEKINCFQCKYYFVTWEPEMPKGCKAYKFKSMKVPSLIVEEESGKPCSLFALKEKDIKKKSLDDDSNW